MCYIKPLIWSHTGISGISVATDVGADSVSSTLSTLSSCKPPPTHDDFDVFAQTRTGVLSTPAHTK